MIRLYLLFKNGEERVVNVATHGEEQNLTEEQKHDIVDEMLKLIEENDHLRMSESNDTRVYIQLGEVVYAKAEILMEEEDADE